MLPSATSLKQPRAFAFSRPMLLPHSTAAVLPWVLAILALISWYYVFLASAGRFTDLPTQLDYYDQMAEGFRAGHLYVQHAPTPALASSPNPFDRKFFGTWLWDGSLYKGHYYLYWGPLPALGILAYKVITGSHERITDQWPTTLFMLGRLYAGAGLILSLASRPRLRQPPWLVCLSIAVFGLANPSPFLVARPHVYEASLAGSQCFLFLGLLGAFWGIERPRHRRWFFALAGVAWALGMGCRATVIVAVPFAIAISVAFAWYGTKSSWKERIADGAALGAPVVVVGLSYAWYNVARFDSPTEFGLHLQTTLQPFFSRSAYIAPNVYAYLFAPVKWTAQFPYVHIVGGRPPDAIVAWPPGYQTFERVGGVLITTWWCWLVVVCVLRAATLVGRRARTVAGARVPLPTMYEVWALSCSAACLLTMLPVLSLWEASMRYAEDALGGIVLASTIAAFWLLRRARAPRRRWFDALWPALVAVLGVQTCVVGALSAFTAYDDPIKTLNAPLYRKLERALSFGPAPRARP